MSYETVVIVALAIFCVVYIAKPVLVICIIAVKKRSEIFSVFFNSNNKK